MRRVPGFPVACAALLAGCASAEDRMVDLSAIVFVIYLALILLKYSAPRVIASIAYQRAAAVIANNNAMIWRTLAAFGILLALLAPVLGGIHRILLFAGFVLLIVGFAFRLIPFNGDSSQGNSRLPFEIITLGFGVLFVLLMMWFAGADMFDGF